MKRGSQLQRIHRIIALAVAGLGLVSGAGLAQQTFAGATDVVVVEVPVQVVKDGEPVRGLTAKDFELYDGRKKVPVTGFEVLDLATPVAAGSPAAAAVAQQVPVSARRHFLMLFDLSNSEPKSIVKARAAALGLVDGLHPTDLIAVATYSSLQGPQLVIGFTPDRKQIATAIDTLGVPKLVDRSPDPLKLVLTDAQHDISNKPSTGLQGRNTDGKAAMDEAVLDNLQGLATQSNRADRTIQQQVLRRMTKSFTDLARLMGEVEGRKYVVFLSEGYDSSLVSGTANTLGADEPPVTGDETRIIAPTSGTGSDERFGDTGSQNAVEKMLEAFRRADCAIQAVDIGGLRAGNDQGAQRPSGREALFNMAKSTGGELFENFNNLQTAMGQMLRRTGVTYVLSYQPDSLKPDGTFHPLKVELKNAPRGARVVSRPGYYAPLPYKQQQPLARVLETASTVLGEESGAVVTAVLAAPFAAASGDRAWVPVVIEVNGVSLLAGKQDPKLPVEIYIYALDENGSVQDFVTQTVGLDLTKAESQLRQSGLKFFAQLELPKGHYTLRTLVRNGSTGASSLRVTDVVVPAFGKGEPALLPAFFPEAPGRWVMVRETPKAGQTPMPYPFMLKEAPYIPSSKPVLAPGQETQIVLQGYNLAAGEVKAEAKVLAADGKEVGNGIVKLGGRDGAGSLMRMPASFSPPALPPGDYQLRVTLVDSAGKSQTSMAHFAVGSGVAPPRGSH
ncbi:MAG TPA: VWA domain-containing protein [Thermoanaerobaculia bacterium]|jgi:VWFA-related protein|nr:VWA domain-containing protein [Thermoanaerobaculia bacterium]